MGMSHYASWVFSHFRLFMKDRTLKVVGKDNIFVSVIQSCALIGLY